MAERDASYVMDMLTAARALVTMVTGRTRPDLDEDVQLQSAVYWQICVLGEAANHLSNSFREEHPETPWHEIVGMRNRLIHGYRDIHNDTLWAVLQTRLPALVTFLSRLMRSEADDAHPS